MTISEKSEVIIILISGFSLFLIVSVFPKEIEIGRLFLYTSALLLFQSLIRDLWILSKNRKIDKLKPQRMARCMCIESTIGAVGVLIGLMLLGLGIDRTVVMNEWIWVILIEATLTLGYYIKDFVFEWKPWRVYRDKDHINIAFTWKAK